MQWRYGKSIPHGGICPVFFCSHSLMDRISDSGSDGLGSNPDGSTTTVKIFSPDEMNRQGFAEDLACFCFVVFQEFGRDLRNHRYQNGHEGFHVHLPVGPCGPVRHAGDILSTSCAPCQSGQSSGNSVPRKRFRRNRMNLAKSFVPRKRFIRDKTARTRRRSEICEAYTGDIS